MSVLVGSKAPDFITPAVLSSGEIVDNCSLYSAFKHSDYVLLFFYPLDFTFVCPSELLALDNRMAKFKERKVEVLTVSVDSQYVHNAWRNTPVEKGGIGQVQYTMIADVNHSICRAYGVEHPEAGVALRAAFIIDNKGKVWAELVHDLPIGRDIDELLRVIDATKYYKEYGEVCPAGWQQGKKAMKGSPQGVAEYLAANARNL